MPTWSISWDTHHRLRYHFVPRQDCTQKKESKACRMKKKQLKKVGCEFWWSIFSSSGCLERKNCIEFCKPVFVPIAWQPFSSVDQLQFWIEDSPATFHDSGCQALEFTLQKTGIDTKSVGRTQKTDLWWWLTTVTVKLLGIASVHHRVALPGWTFGPSKEAEGKGGELDGRVVRPTKAIRKQRSRRMLLMVLCRYGGL